jgi:scyllo-inositol 2-dehydrogenase (NADP+)
MEKRPIKTALCSFGMSGRVFHAPFLHFHPGFTLYSVWERDKNLATAAYPSVHIRRSLQALLEDEAVELVVVNTPNYTHYDYTQAAMLAGKHVVVEKPFTTTVAEAQTLTELAARLGKCLSIYQNRRYDSDFKTVRQVLDSGLLGHIAEAELHFDRYNQSLSPKQHKETPGPGTGILFDLGPHLIDQAVQLFGMPESVFADLRIQRPVSRVGDYMEVLLYYPTFPVRLKSGYLVKEALPAYILHGAKGSFMKTRADVQERLLLEGIPPSVDLWGIEPESERGLLHTGALREYVPTLPGNYGTYYDQLYEAIRNGGPLPVTAADGVSIMRVIEASVQSSREKTVVGLPTQKGYF